MELTTFTRGKTPDWEASHEICTNSLIMCSKSRGFMAFTRDCEGLPQVVLENLEEFKCVLSAAMDVKTLNRVKQSFRTIV